MKQRTKSGVCVVVAALAVGCAPPAKGNRGKTQIGAVMPKTGTLSNLYDIFTGALSFAVGQINAAGGVNDTDLELVIKDEANGIIPDGGTGTGVEGALAACNELVDAGVQVVIGPGISSDALAAVPILAGNSRLFFAPAAGASALSTAADNDFLFRTITPTPRGSKPAAKALYDDGARKIAILHLDSTVAIDVANVLETEFKALSGTVTVNHQYSYSATSFDANSHLQAIFSTNPDAVFVYGTANDTIALLTAWNKTDYSGKWMLAGASAAPGVATAVGTTKMVGIRTIVQSLTTGSEMDKFLADFKTNNGFDPATIGTVFATTHYDAIMTVGLAMAKAHSGSATAVRDALRSVSNAPGEPIAPSQIADGLTRAAAGEDINYNGLTSPIEYDANGDCDVIFTVSQFNASGQTDKVKDYIPGIDY